MFISFLLKSKVSAINNDAVHKTLFGIIGGSVQCDLCFNIQIYVLLGHSDFALALTFIFFRLFPLS